MTVSLHSIANPVARFRPEWDMGAFNEAGYLRLFKNTRMRAAGEKVDTNLLSLREKSFMSPCFLGPNSVYAAGPSAYSSNDCGCGLDLWVHGWATLWYNNTASL